MILSSPIMPWSCNDLILNNKNYFVHSKSKDFMLHLNNLKNELSRGKNAILFPKTKIINVNVLEMEDIRCNVQDTNKVP